MAVRLAQGQSSCLQPSDTRVQPFVLSVNSCSGTLGADYIGLEEGIADAIRGSVESSRESSA